METSAKTFWNSDRPISPVSVCEEAPGTSISRPGTAGPSWRMPTGPLPPFAAEPGIPPGPLRFPAEFPRNLKTGSRRFKISFAQRFWVRFHRSGTNGNLNKNDSNF